MQTTSALIGFSHRKTSFELLGRIAISPPYLPGMLQALRADPAIEEVAGLATCNRTEFFCLTRSPEQARDTVLNRLSELQCLTVPELEPHCMTLEGSEAVRHLLAVACGIDSLIVGEYEILGQVRQALEAARKCGTAGPFLETIFQRALRTGRIVRERTNISRGNLSVASAAAHLIGERLPDLAGRRALVIGSGEAGRQIVRSLAKSGIASTMIANRTPGRATSLAGELGCTPVPMEKIGEAIASSDIVICATAAPHYVVTQQLAQEAGAPAGGVRVFADLSAPPNIDPAVARLPGSVLLTLGDLRSIAGQNEAQRHEEIQRVERLIDEELAGIESWARTFPVQEVVRDFRRTMEDVRRQHLRRHGRRFDKATREEMDRHTRSLVDAMLHEVTARLSSLDPDTAEGRRALRMARELFGGVTNGRHSPSEHE